MKRRITVRKTCIICLKPLFKSESYWLKARRTLKGSKMTCGNHHGCRNIYQRVNLFIFDHWKADKRKIHGDLLKEDDKED